MDDANLNGQKEGSAYNVTKQSMRLKQLNVEDCGNIPNNKRNIILETFSSELLDSRQSPYASVSNTASSGPSDSRITQSLVLARSILCPWGKILITSHFKIVIYCAWSKKQTVCRQLDALWASLLEEEFYKCFLRRIDGSYFAFYRRVCFPKVLAYKTSNLLKKYRKRSVYVCWL